MTREEQIRKYAEEKCVLYDDIGFDDEAYSLIIETAEYADRTMIDKVCNLIEENIDYVCLHLGNCMEKEVDAKELSEWIRNLWNTNAR